MTFGEKLKELRQRKKSVRNSWQKSCMFRGRLSQNGKMERGCRMLKI